MRKPRGASCISRSAGRLLSVPMPWPSPVCWPPEHIGGRAAGVKRAEAANLFVVALQAQIEVTASQLDKLRVGAQLHGPAQEGRPFVEVAGVGGGVARRLPIRVVAFGQIAPFL